MKGQHVLENHRPLHSEQLQPLGVHVTRLARGLPVGGDLEYADQNTLLRALTGRQEMS